eukprot:g7906.t1
MSEPVTSAPGDAARWAPGVKMAKAFRDLEEPVLGVDVARDLCVCYSRRELAVYDFTTAVVEEGEDEDIGDVGAGRREKERPPAEAEDKHGQESARPNANGGCTREDASATSSSAGDAAPGAGAAAPSGKNGDDEDHEEDRTEIRRVIIKQTDPTHAFLLTSSAPSRSSTFFAAQLAEDQTEREADADGKEKNPSPSASSPEGGGGQAQGQAGDVEMADATATHGAEEHQKALNADKLQLIDLFGDGVLFEMALNRETHEAINFIALHPNQDVFLLGTTCAISLWDYGSYFKKKQENKPAELQCLGRLATVGETTSAAFDSQGMVFGLCSGKDTVHLFDSKTFNKGSFLTFQLKEPCRSLEFSPCGKYVLCNCTQLLDAYDGDPIVEYRLPRSVSAPPRVLPAVGAGFSPDSEFVLLRTNESVHIFSTTNGQLERTIFFPAEDNGGTQRKPDPENGAAMFSFDSLYCVLDGVFRAPLADLELLMEGKLLEHFTDLKFTDHLGFDPRDIQTHQFAVSVAAVAAFSVAFLPLFMLWCGESWMTSSTSRDKKFCETGKKSRRGEKTGKVLKETSADADEKSVVQPVKAVTMEEFLSDEEGAGEHVFLPSGTTETESSFASSVAESEIDGGVSVAHPLLAEEQNKATTSVEVLGEVDRAKEVEGQALHFQAVPDYNCSTASNSEPEAEAEIVKVPVPEIVPKVRVKRASRGLRCCLGGGI